MAAIGHVDIWDRTNGNFDRTRREASVRRVPARLSGNRNRLLSFEESGEALSACPIYLALRPVEVGSIGRYRDFDQDRTEVAEEGRPAADSTQPPGDRRPDTEKAKSR